MRFLVIVAGTVGSLAAGEAMAMDRSCAVTEVAPGVKMRSGSCSNVFDSRPQPYQEVSPQTVGPLMTGRPATLRFGNSEVRMGGQARFEMQRGR
ncbi:hypothetical protein SLNSH_21130 [Alsobacter soli]|uniref:Uncharacterized protein n=1 Tax=Alsobacter soli TaxID=2109933 RepID=A0A2T1HN08_9HYPH|nr:hypothetical protein [Alsobacter soli]PSC03013.1 hypothetical protein SLNSH_21130 [Alsobacter soli]